MGVHNVSGNDPAGAVSLSLARIPPGRPPPRSAGAEEVASPSRARAGPEQEQVEIPSRPARKEAAAKVQRSGTRLRVDDASDRIVAQILDANREVIKQIPPEERLRITVKAREMQRLLRD